MPTRRITMAFSPLSDVVAFSYRDGETHLKLLEALRRKYNELVANYNNLISHIQTLEEGVSSAFNEYVAQTVIPFEEYQDMTAALETLRAELAPYATTDTDYVALLG